MEQCRVDKGLLLPRLQFQSTVFTSQKAGANLGTHLQWCREQNSRLRVRRLETAVPPCANLDQFISSLDSVSLSVR